MYDFLSCIFLFGLVIQLAISLKNRTILISRFLQLLMFMYRLNPAQCRLLSLECAQETEADHSNNSQTCNAAPNAPVI